MAYSIVGIVNIALQRIGVKRIASLTEDSVQAIDANAAWEYIRDEVLEAHDWNFAKLRYKLAQSTLKPEYGYDYAYGLPADFLRLAKTKKDDPCVYVETAEVEYPHVLETLSDGNVYLLTDFDNASYDIFIKYIKRVTDPSKYTGHFISSLAWRLAAQLSIVRTETASKFDWCMRMYDISLLYAKGLNESMDYLADETGNEDWLNAGRL